MRQFQCLLFILFLCLPSILFSATLLAPYDMYEYDRTIDQLYQTILKKTHSLDERLQKLSCYFVGKPYLLGALGEGANGTFDQSPLYRTDYFDCVTYVSTVLALALSEDRFAFQRKLKKIQYKNGKVSFISRRHFTNPEWNANDNLKDVTSSVTPRYKAITVRIDKSVWLYTLSHDRLKQLKTISLSREKQLLHLLRLKAVHIHPVITHLNYIPLTEFFRKEQNTLFANQFLFQRIPFGIVEIVDLDRIVHMGFVIPSFSGIIFRHASSIHNRIIDVPLIQYLARYYVSTHHPENVGIHLLKIKGEKNVRKISSKITYTLYVHRNI